MFFFVCFNMILLFSQIVLYSGLWHIFIQKNFSQEILPFREVNGHLESYFVFDELALYECRKKYMIRDKIDVCEQLQKFSIRINKHNKQVFEYQFFTTNVFQKEYESFLYELEIFMPDEKDSYSTEGFMLPVQLSYIQRIIQYFFGEGNQY